MAFYKLCALKYVSEMDYENVLLIDTDTYIQRNLNDVWKESRYNILLYDISRGLYNRDYRTFAEEAQAFLESGEYLTRWGGEFIAGNRELIRALIRRCERIYDRMRQEKFKTINGDEFVLSIAAWEMRDRVKNAAAYVFRYWTAYRWHYVCSNYASNPVCVLHCPREKNHGFLRLFRWMERHEHLPRICKVYRALSLDLWSYVKIELIKGIAHLKN